MTMSSALRCAPCLFLMVVAKAQLLHPLPPRNLPPLHSSTQCVLVADLDGDGDRDIVFGNADRLFRNRGDGVFDDDTRLPPPVALHDETMAIASGDFDGDGDVDLVFATGHYTNGSERLLFNDGSGRFTDVTASRLPADVDPTWSVATGDIDGDGDLDLVFGNNGLWAQPCRVCANDGTGTFADVTAAWLGSAAPVATSVALADFDLDGDLDLIVSDPLRLFRNVGGAFVDVSATHVPAGITARPVVVADFDGDGDRDVFCPGARLLRNIGGVLHDVTATHLPAMPTTWGDAAHALDIDGDLDIDLVMGRSILRNDGSGAFAVAATSLPDFGDQVVAIGGGDFDGDGDADLVVGAHTMFQAAHGHLLLGDGTGDFVDVSPLRVPAAPTVHDGPLVTGDFDGDGDVDVALLGHDLRVWNNDGAGWLRDSTPADMASATVSGWCRAALAFDADDDGDLDLAAGRPGDLSLWSNDGHGGFMPARAGTLLLGQLLAIASGDFDGDGDDELVCGIANYQPLLLERSGGQFVLTGRIPLHYGPWHTWALAVGDVDADSDLDIVAGNDGAPCRLYRNRGDGWFVEAPASLPAATGATRGLALVDVDVDGDLDLFCANSYSASSQSAQDRLYLNDGTGHFVDATVTRLPVDDRDAHTVAAGDIDDDGDVDLLLGCWDSYRPDRRLLRNDGTGHFDEVTATSWPGQFPAGSVVVADLDRDGDLDAIHTSGAMRCVSMNLTRQLHAPWPARLGRSFALEVTHRGASGPGLAVPFLSTTRLGGVATPLGVLGIAPTLLLPPILVPPAAGTGTLQFGVPTATALVGLTFHAQALLVAAPAGARLTNVTSNTIMP